MKDIKLIKIFISCPGDIKDEINSIQLILKDINKTSGKHNDFILESLNWKDDTYTGIAEDAQEVINSQLEEEYDLLVGIVWLKVGTPTKRDQSGTIEEINNAIKSGKHFLLYFKSSSPDNINEIDLEQLSKVKAFKRELSDKGVLYKEFNTVKEFESLFRLNISNLIFDKIINRSNSNDKTVIPETQDKYSDITNLISQVENYTDTNSIDIFQSAEEIETYSNNMTSSLSSMTVNLDDLGERMKNRTIELERANHIKDDRLRVAKGKTLINLFASELDDFNSRLRAEIPIFSDNFLNLIHSYSQLILALADFETDEINGMKNSAIGFKESLEYSLKACAGLLRQIMAMPPMNFKFNNAKRETELVLKDVTKEMLNGLKILDEVIK